MPSWKIADFSNASPCAHSTQDWVSTLLEAQPLAASAEMHNITLLCNEASFQHAFRKCSPNLVSPRVQALPLLPLAFPLQMQSKYLTKLRRLQDVLSI
jgi:hypothetical protein